MRLRTLVRTDIARVPPTIDLIRLTSQHSRDDLIGIIPELSCRAERAAYGGLTG